MTSGAEKSARAPERAKGSKARAVADALTLAVHEHRLTPGLKLNEDEVGEIFGVGRTIVRSALQMLAHEQLVTIEPNRGAFVAEPSIREAREVFEARALLEPRTARSAAERITPEGIARLRAHSVAEHEALDRGDFGTALRLSGAFHIEIARIADQSTIAEFITQLIARSSLVIALYWRRPEAMCETHAHEALLSALERGDGATAEEMMKGHLLDLLSSLDLREAPPPPQSLRDALRP
ncbi:GntR family transcriptional regulator [Yangia mangrovi]|uniref:GntR family transcriptional regulator n=1 Tax=Alloyangia mangrovi TaxID=1779329 RepID=A0A2A3JTA9_9RHOB|nr:GntR family transcriptional regulator [Alloyangia mangrovi]MCT4370278.1 GntR family transcriptional regulator [Alloyangia mangrovi]